MQLSNEQRPYVKTVAVVDTPSPSQASITPPPAVSSQAPQIIKKGTRFHPKYMIFVIPAVLLIATIVIAEIIISQFSKNLIVVPVPEPSPSLIPATPPPEIAARTKTYKNPQLGISFEYEESFVLAECEDVILLHSVAPEQSNDACLANDKAIKVTFSKQELDADELIPFEGVVNSEEKTIAGITMTKEERGETLAYLFTQSDINFIFSANKALEPSLEKILQSIKSTAIVNTQDWLDYQNTPFQFTFKYPPEWEVKEEADKVVIGNLTLQTIKEENGELSASQIIASTRNLIGWRTSPEVQFRRIGASNAEIIKGPFNGYWQAYVVLWSQDNVIQIAYTDKEVPPKEEVLEAILASFTFQ